MKTPPENTLVASKGEIYSQLEIYPVKVPPAPNWNIGELVKQSMALPLPKKGDKSKQSWVEAQLARCSPEELDALRHKWSFWARPNQIAPEGEWTFWTLLAGRGFGKTRTGAEWVNERVQQGKAKRIALVAPTAADVRKVMVEGESGILAISPPWNRPLFEPSKLQLTWPNGAIAQLFSAEEPERLRGPQCDTFWADELAAWKKLQETWDMLQFGFRLGDDPRGCITTTPKPLPIVKQLVQDAKDRPENLRGKNWTGQTVLVKGSTYENRANLAKKYFENVVKQYEGTRLGRQELNADILEDMPGALWKRSDIDVVRISAPALLPIWKDASEVPGDEMVLEKISTLTSIAVSIMSCVPEDLSRVIVAVDPNVSNNEGSDEIGIVVSGKGLSGRAYVLADCSMKGTPNEWATTAIIAHDIFKADRIIGEANQGGNMVEYVLQTAARGLKDSGHRPTDNIGVTLVHATRGKVTRAEPSAALYEQNRVSHVGQHTVLEDQMCLFTSDFDRKAMGYSPDRVDALVWALTHLFNESQDGAGIFEYFAQEAQKLLQAKEAKNNPANWIRMKAPHGHTQAFGMEGDRYNVVEGYIFCKPEDVQPFEGGGWVAEPAS